MSTYFDSYSMSRGAKHAYDIGRLPVSKINRTEIVRIADEFGMHAETVSMLAVKDVKAWCLKNHDGEWHHTSKYANRTKFYDVAMALDELGGEHIYDDGCISYK